MMPRGRLGTACIIVAFFGVALGFTGLILQAAHILPAGESAAKTRFAILFSTVCAAFWFLTAASVREFRWSGGTRMPIWLGRSLCILAGVFVSTIAILAALGTIH
jgi:hypothetical protein